MSIFGKILATFSIVVIVLTTHGSAQTSAAGDVVGQMAIGYQGWFGTQNDGSPLNVWYEFSLFSLASILIHSYEQMQKG